MKQKIVIWALLGALVLSGPGCESLTWRTPVAAGLGCAAGLGLGAVVDEMNRSKDQKNRRKDIFGIFKKKKEQNNGKIVGLATGCLAGLGVGLYLDLMHDDMENQFGSKGIQLEKVAAPNGDTKELLVKMDGDITFDSGKASLQDKASSNVSTLAEALEKYPETKVRIWGHTDGTGTRATNDRLSLERAQTVGSGLNVASGRLSEVKGWANDKPTPGTSKAGNVPQNRRVEVFILADG